MKLYRMQFNDGSFQHAGFIGHTKDKHLALLSSDLLEKFSRLYSDNEYSVLEVVIADLQPCFYKMNAFDVETNAYVISETNLYVYVVNESLGNIAFSSIQKFKKSEIGTIGLKSSGIRF